MNGELAQEDIKLYLIMMVIYIVSVSTFDFAQNIIQLLITKILDAVKYLRHFYIFKSNQ
jgi:hypothetical protein